MSDVHARMAAAATRGSTRLIIVYDGEGWHVRRLTAIKHDLETDEKVYYCDEPIANDCGTGLQALVVANRWIRDNR